MAAEMHGASRSLSARRSDSAPPQLPPTTRDRANTRPVRPPAHASEPRFGAGQLSLHFVQTFFGPDRADALLRDASLFDRSGQPPASVSRIAFWNLCVGAIHRYKDEGHGCTPQSLPKSTWTMIFTAVNHSSSVGDGLERFCEFVEVVPTGMSVTVGHGRDGVHLSYAMRNPSERGEIYVELMALVFHCVLLWGTARAIEPVQVRLSSMLDDRDGSLLAGLARRSWRSGCGVSVIYPPEVLDYQLGVRRYTSFAFHETTTFLEVADRPPPAADAEEDPALLESLRQLMQHEPLSQQAAARTLGMSAATLQRRLSRAGTSFRDLSRELRIRKLRTLLATDASLDDIAFDLGFSDRRSLWRACFDWLGMSPTTYRQQRRGLA